MATDLKVAHRRKRPKLSQNKARAGTDLRKISPMTLALGAAMFLVGLSLAAAAPYRAIIATEVLGISNDQYALIVAVGAVVGAAVSLALGALSDVIKDRRWLVILCAAVGAFGYGLVSQVPVALVFAIAFGAIIPLGNAALSQILGYARSYYAATDPDAAAFMMSVLRSLISLAWVIVPPLAGWIAAQGSPLVTFDISAVAGVGVVLIFVALAFVPAAAAASNRSEGVPAPLRIAPERLWGLGGIALIRCALIMSATTTPLVLRMNYGASLADVGINASVAAAMEVPMMLGWAYAAKRWSSEGILALNAVIYAIYFGLIPFAGSSFGVLMLQPLNALATAALLSLTIAYAQEAIAGRVGTSTALIDTLTLVATWIGAALFAALARPDSYFSVIAALGVCSLLGGAMIWFKARPQA